MPSLKWSLRVAFGLSLPLLAALPASCNSAIINGSEVGADGGTDDGSDRGPPQIPGCVGSCVVNFTCSSSMGPTSITGVVSIPAGNLPINNAQVYIPVGPTMPGPPSRRCRVIPVAPQPSPFSTTTDVNGRFATRMCRRQNIPLIVQVGKWRHGDSQHYGLHDDASA